MWTAEHSTVEGEQHLRYEGWMSTDQAKPRLTTFTISQATDTDLRIKRQEHTRSGVYSSWVYVPLRGWQRPWAEQAVAGDTQEGSIFFVSGVKMTTTVVRHDEQMFTMPYSLTNHNTGPSKRDEIFVPVELMHQWMVDLPRIYGLTFINDLLTGYQETRPLAETLLTPRGRAANLTAVV